MAFWLQVTDTKSGDELLFRKLTKDEETRETDEKTGLQAVEDACDGMIPIDPEPDTQYPNLATFCVTFYSGKPSKKARKEGACVVWSQIGFYAKG